MSRELRGPSSYNVLLWSVIGMTAVCVAATFLLAYFPPPHEAGLIDTFTSALKLGMGAIVGVFGGRSADMGRRRPR